MKKLLSSLILILSAFYLSAQVSFNIDTNQGCAPLSITFTNTTNNDSLFYWWDFGDGGSYFGEDTIYTYAEGGVYTVTLMAFDGWFPVGTADTTITVIGNYSSFAAPDSACPGDTILFENYDIGTGHFWDFGDGSLDTGQAVKHIYASPGSYNVQLIIESSCGRDTIADSVFINNNVAVNAFFTAVPQNTCPGDTVRFNSPLQEPGSYYWTFGDGDTSTATSPAHVYASEGEFPVSLTITNSCGNTDTYFDTVTMQTNTFTDAAIFSTGDTVCPGDPITFYADANAESYIWDFGFITDTGQYVTYVYLLSGSHTVSLTLTNACGFDTTITTEIFITQDFPSINVYALPNPACPGETVYFSTDYFNAATYYWDFGDGTGDSAIFTAHTYLNPGNYSASLNLTNSCGGDTTIPVNILIGGEPPVIQQSGDSLIAVTAGPYQWLISGDTISGANNNYYIPTQTGNYSVATTDIYGCESVSNSIYVNLSGIHDPDLQGIKVYPTLVGDYLTIENPTAEKMNIRLLNILGQETAHFNTAESDKTVLSISELNLVPGVYWLNIMTEEKSYNFKIVKK